MNIRKHGCIVISARGWTLSTCPWKVWRKTISCFQRFWWFKLHPHVHEKYEKKPYPGFKDFGGSQCMRGSLQFHQLSLRHEKCSTERFPFSPNCPHASDQIGLLPQKYRLQFVKPHTLQRTYFTSAENGNFRAQIWWCWNVRGKPLKMPLDLWNFQK